MAKSLVPEPRTGREGPLDIFSSLHREIDRVFHDFAGPGGWSGWLSEAGNGAWRPSIDVSETPTHIEVTAELPGVKEGDIDVSVVDDMLTVKGEKKSESEKKDKDYRLIERSYGSFERRMQLPCEVDTSATEATFKDGVLKVSLKKTPAAEARSHKIRIKAA